jgi:hypothetical protein
MNAKIYFSNIKITSVYGFPIFLFTFWLSASLGWSQTPMSGLSFSEQLAPSVAGSNGILSLAFSGGLNNPQWSNADLNEDGQQDLVVFDRTGQRWLVFVHEGLSGSTQFRYAPELAIGFPALREWALLIDYNGDQKPDIFGYTLQGVGVWKNLGLIQGIPTFEKITDALPTRYGSIPANLFVSLADIPALADIDQDGDIDLLTFNILGGCVEWHRHMGMEWFGRNDTLTYQLETSHWGVFREGNSLSELFLNDSCSGTGGVPNPGGPRHAGSTMLVQDFTGDGLVDMALGDAGANQMALLINGGNLNKAVFTSTQANFPATLQLAQSIQIPTFPAAFYVDANGDQIKDLLASPNDMGVGEDRSSVWFYQNIGQNNLPNFSLISQRFLQDRMIDLGSGAYPTLAFLSGTTLPDLIIGNDQSRNQSAKLAWFKPVFNGDGSWQYELQTEDLAQLSTRNWFHLVPSFADFDQDGDADLVVGERTGQLHYLENVGSPTQPQFVLSQSPWAGIQVNADLAPACVDLDLDGKIDLVVGSRNGRLQFFKNYGTAQMPLFQATPDIVNLGNVLTVHPSLGSQGYAIPYFFTHQGKLQLMVGSLGGTFFHYDELHDAQMQVATTFRLLSDHAGFIKVGIRSAPALFDFNQDGFPELIAGNYAGGLQWFQGRAFDLSQSPMPAFEGPIIFPNPGNQHFALSPSLQEEVMRIRATNALGQVFHAETWGNGWSTKSWPPGWYMLEVIRKNQSPMWIKWVKTDIK